MTAYQKYGEERTNISAEKESISASPIRTHSKRKGNPSSESSAGNLAIQRKSSSSKTVTFTLQQNSQFGGVEIRKRGKDMATVYVYGIAIAEAQFYKQQGQGFTISIRELSDSEGNITKLQIRIDCEPYVRMQLLNGGVARLSQKLGSDVEVGSMPTGLEVEGGVESETGLMPPRESQFVSAEPQEAKPEPQESEPEETKQKPESLPPEKPEPTIWDRVIEPLRTWWDRRKVKKLLKEAADMQFKGEEGSEELMNEAAEIATEILKRKVWLFDTETANKEIAGELLLATEHVMLQGGGEEATEDALNELTIWTLVELDRAVTDFKNDPDDDTAEVMLDKAAQAQLFGAESEETEEAVELFMSYQESPKEEGKGILGFVKDIINRIKRFFGF